ncbi:hypothetical protein B0H17DRAFT_1333797 [Mycena rosella]|uniref:Uncharacterized protein n=1 Tax=Mycena rosella TaxID=1033263 RepID=A0AAD7GDE2_MYCRO|nr:hypothetical protein B0H17DRAFT_1333797 [Mycena rosella]
MDPLQRHGLLSTSSTTEVARQNFEHKAVIHRVLAVAYGSPTDPGVEFVVASSSADVATLFPSVEARTSGVGAFDASSPGAFDASSPGAFDASSLAALDLLPNDLALTLPPHTTGSEPFAALPSLIVQVISFQCGGAVIALRSSHTLADAQALTGFVNDWAAVHRALLQILPLPVPVPVFSPATLNSAAGDIDAASPHPEVFNIAREWASKVDVLFPVGWMEVPPHLAALTDIEHGQSLGKTRISCRSRTCDPSSSARRLTPPLSPCSLGSLVMLARAEGTSTMSLAELARTIRGTVEQFTPARVAVLLHEMAFDVDAPWMWGAFLGRQNTIVTS